MLSTIADSGDQAIAFVILASGLKYIGLGTTELGWTLCGLLLLAALTWLGTAQPWRSFR